MSMLPSINKIVCGVGKTKQKTGVEHDINKIIEKYRRTGQMPVLKYDGEYIMDKDNIVDLTEVGDYQECMNKKVNAETMFHKYPSKIRREFNNDPVIFTEFIGSIKEDSHNMARAIKLGIIQITEMPKKTTVNKSQKEVIENADKLPKN